MRDSILSPAGYALDPAAYGKPGFQPESPVSISAPQQVRSLLISTVTIAPVQFNGSAQTVRRYSRLVIQITFGAGGTLAPNHPDAVLLGGALLNGAVLGAVPQTPARPRAVTSSVLAAGRWSRLSVTDDGIYRLDYAALTQIGIPVGTLDPRTLRIFGNGGRELSEDVTRPRPQDLVENAIYVQGEQDGKFDPGDYLLFYGRSVRGFVYNAATRTLEHYLHHYTESNVYWLTYGGAAGKRMALQHSDISPATFVPDRFQDAVAVEEEKLKPKGIISGKLWTGCWRSGNADTGTRGLGDAGREAAWCFSASPRLRVSASASRVSASYLSSLILHPSSLILHPSSFVPRGGHALEAGGEGTGGSAGVPLRGVLPAFGGAGSNSGSGSDGGTASSPGAGGVGVLPGLSLGTGLGGTESELGTPRGLASG